MAYTKIITIHDRLDKSIGYVLNPDKTDEMILTGSVNCAVDSAYDMMTQTKQSYGKTNGALGYHIIQSFKPGEITQEMALKVLEEYVTRYLGEKYEAVYAVHNDKGHIHGHIVFNSVSFKNGKKYRSSRPEYYQNARGIMNDICREYGLSVILEQDERQGVSYREWWDTRHGNVTWKQLVSKDIDEAIAKTYSYGEFQAYMEDRGYEIKHGKHVAFRPYGKERFVRGKTLGSRYAEESIKARIAGWEDVIPYLTDSQPRRVYYRGKFPIQSKVKMHGMKALYWRYLYMLGKVKKRPQIAPAKLRADVQRYHQINEQYAFINKNGLETAQDLISFVEQTTLSLKQAEHEKYALMGQRKKLKPHFDELALLQALGPAHQMYIEGNFSVSKEHHAYEDAKERLAKAGYDTPDKLKKLAGYRVKLYERLSKVSSQVRELKSDLSMCERVASDAEVIKEIIQNTKGERYYESRSASHRPGDTYSVGRRGSGIEIDGQRRQERSATHHGFDERRKDGR